MEVHSAVELLHAYVTGVSNFNRRCRAVDAHEKTRPKKTAKFTVFPLKSHA
jgi:hypothetical protein